MDTYQLIDKVFDIFHLLWVVVALASFGVFLIFKRRGWLILAMAMNATTLASQIVWTYCPLIILQNMVWNRGHPDHPRAIRSVTCDLLRDHLGVNVLPWMVTASLAVLFLAMLWLAYRIYSQKTDSQDTK